VSPKALDQNVTTVFRATAVVEEVFVWVSLHFFDQFWFQGATGVDFGFVVNQGKRKGLGSKVAQSILNLIVA
jgi:hypothetical protein